MAKNADVTISIEGMEDVIRALKEMPDEVRPALRKALKAGAEAVQKDAKRLAPVDTGNLRRNIINRKAYDDKSGVVFIVGPRYPEAAYGHLVEFGTQGHRVSTTKRTLSDGSVAYGQTVQVSGAPAQPFLRPAHDANRKKIAQMIVEAVKKELGL